MRARILTTGMCGSSCLYPKHIVEHMSRIKAFNSNVPLREPCSSRDSLVPILSDRSCHAIFLFQEGFGFLRVLCGGLCSHSVCLHPALCTVTCKNHISHSHEPLSNNARGAPQGGRPPGGYDTLSRLKHVHPVATKRICTRDGAEARRGLYLRHMQCSCTFAQY